MHDSRALTDQVEFFDPPSIHQQDMARKTVCSFATDAEDAAALLRMLGIFPGEEVEAVAPVVTLRYGSLR